MRDEQFHRGGCPVLLFAFANDDRPGRRLDGLRREIERLRRALAPAEREGVCEVVIRESTTPQELIEVLEDPRYRRRLALIHFAGHASGSRLMLEGDVEPVETHIEGFAPLLAELDGLALVFLNGCATISQGQGLVARKIPAVVATDRIVEDHQAQRFAADFYRALAAGEPIGVAFDRARHQAACFQAAPGVSRDLQPGTGTGTGAEGSPPWRLLLAEPAGDAGAWSLPIAANDPLFGLPEPVDGALPQEPYMGLRRFTAQDCSVFFGRGRAIRNLYHDITTPTLPLLLVIYGASGVGKSSLLEAGLLPRLAVEHQVHALRLERGQDPVQVLRQALGDAEGIVGLADAWRACERTSGRALVVCIDQLEVLLLEEGGGDRLARFIRALEPLLGADARPRGKLLLSLRKEWFPELRNELRGRRVEWHEHFVEPLDRDDIEEVVLGPTRTASLRSRYGIACEAGLARRIADDLLRDRESAIAPVLQILLTRMWERAEAQLSTSKGRVQRSFTLAMYDELRGEGLALSDFVDRQLDALRLTHAEASVSGLALDLLFRHTTPRGTAVARSYDALQELYAHCWPDVRALIERCVSLYLLLPYTNGHGEPVGGRLVHDTLAPIIRNRYQQSKAPGQAAARLLEARIGMAENAGRSRLLDEHDLKQVEMAHTGMREWTEEERRLVVQSRRRVKRAAWGRRLWQLSMLVAVLVATFVISFRSDPDEPEGVVIRESVSPGERPKCVRHTLWTGLTTAVGTMAMTADGQRVALALGGRKKVFVLEPLAASNPSFDSFATLEAVRHLAWSPGGDRLAVGQRKGSLELVRWEEGLGTKPTSYPGHAHSICALAFSPDGRSLLSADADGRVIVRKGRDLGTVHETSWEGKIYDVGSKGDAWLLAGARGRLGAWKGTRSEPPSLMPSSRAEPFRRIEWLAGDRKVLVAGARLQVWELKGKAPSFDKGLARVARWMHLMDDGEHVVTASTNSVDLWRWGHGELKHVSDWPHEEIEDLAVLPDTGEIFFVDSKGSVAWLAQTGHELEHRRSFALGSQAVGPIVVDRQRRYFAVGHGDGGVSLVLLPPSLDAALGCTVVPAQSSDRP